MPLVTISQGVFTDEDFSIRHAAKVVRKIREIRNKTKDIFIFI